MEYITHTKGKTTKIKKRDIEILREYINTGRTCNEIGKDHSLSGTRVNQIITAVGMKLRHLYRSRFKELPPGEAFTMRATREVYGDAYREVLKEIDEARRGAEEEKKKEEGIYLTVKASGKPAGFDLVEVGTGRHVRGLTGLSVMADFSTGGPDFVMVVGATLHIFDAERKCLAVAPKHDLGIPDEDNPGVAIVETGHAVELAKCIEEAGTKDDLIELAIEFMQDIGCGDIPREFKRGLMRLNGEDPGPAVGTSFLTRVAPNGAEA